MIMLYLYIFWYLTFEAPNESPILKKNCFCKLPVLFVFMIYNFIVNKNIYLPTAKNRRNSSASKFQSFMWEPIWTPLKPKNTFYVNCKHIYLMATLRSSVFCWLSLAIISATGNSV